MSNITTITFFRFKSLQNKLWALSMMQFAHKDLRSVQGQTFYKLMGSGRGLGFNAWPDFSVYVLVQNWETEKSADSFFKTSKLIQKYNSKSIEIYRVYAYNIAAHGKWDGRNPFKPTREYVEGPVVALTRATIKMKRLFIFWRYVSTSQKPLENNQELLYAKGVGELPVVQMATLSIWQSMEGLKKFAYGSREHKGAIERTKKLDWYKEELFARFVPYKSSGSWNGEDKLERLLK